MYKDWLQLEQPVTDIAKEVGLFVSESQSPDLLVEHKNLHDPVTAIDKESERRLIEKLNKLLPEAGVIAEEGEYEQAKELNWIIDPIDGTTNFIHGIPFYCISIGLKQNDEVVMGVINAMNQKEIFSGSKENGARCNGEKIRVSSEKNTHSAVVATGFPHRDFTFEENYMRILRTFMYDCSSVRRCGSAAMDLAYVACGRFELFFEYGLQPWDVSAGGLLVKEAGGYVGDFNGGQNWLFGRQVVASNAALSKWASKVVGSNWK